MQDDNTDANDQGCLPPLRKRYTDTEQKSVVQINVVTQQGSGLGSGTIIDNRGYIVTNEIDNTPVIDVQTMGDALLSKSPGDTVAVTINSGGQQMTVNVTLGELPASS